MRGRLEPSCVSSNQHETRYVLHSITTGQTVTSKGVGVRELVMNTPDEPEFMESGVTRLRLKQRNETLLIPVDTWRNLIEVAQKKGWPSEHPPACYWGDVGLSVTDSDARRLALVFEAMGDYLTHHHPARPPEEVDELVDNLGELVIFCRSGGFQVC